MSERVMRAKMQIKAIDVREHDEIKLSERLQLSCVAKSSQYPEDGHDEDNSFAKFSPHGELTLTVANPALFGKFTVGEKYYLDFTKAE